MSRARKKFEIGVVYQKWEGCKVYGQMQYALAVDVHELAYWDAEDWKFLKNPEGWSGTFGYSTEYLGSMSIEDFVAEVRVPKEEVELLMSQRFRASNPSTLRSSKSHFSKVSSSRPGIRRYKAAPLAPIEEKAQTPLRLNRRR
jgi:hypothetical protein